MVDSIAKTLGAGSGIDVTALVSSLVENQFTVKNGALTKRAETLTAQLSAVAQLKSGITGFSTALASLVKGGTLVTQPTSSNTNIVKVATLPGAKLAGLNTTLEVRRLASAQVSHTITPLPASVPVGTGTIQLAIGSYDSGGTFVPGAAAIPPITIGAGEDTLSAIAAKINAAAAGVSASIVTDIDGERLVLKGASGAAAAFTLGVTEDSASPGLARIAVGAGATGTTSASSATDALVAVDGVEVRRATNAIADLVSGVRLDLQAAAVGTRVTLGSAPQSESLRQAVNDVVATYNELYAILKTQTDPVSGALRGDPAAREMMRSLGRLSLVDLTGTTDGSPRTLAELGVATARDGTLSVNTSRLTEVLIRFPSAVERMFTDGRGASGAGLSGALSAISTAVTSRTTGLGASEGRYTKARSAITGDQTKATAAAETMRKRLTQQYASMDARVSAYKATQAFLTQQVDAWNAD
jgi:flagellar hook-associated protein 2